MVAKPSHPAQRPLTADQTAEPQAVRAEFGRSRGRGSRCSGSTRARTSGSRCPSNEYLPRHLRLAFADELRVLASPMVPPGLVGPNWSFAITTDDQYAKAAASVVRALAVFGIRPEAILPALSR